MFKKTMALCQKIALICIFVGNIDAAQQTAQQAAEFKAIMTAVQLPHAVSSFELGEPAYQEPTTPPAIEQVTLKKAQGKTIPYRLIKEGKFTNDYINPAALEYFTKKSFASLIQKSQKRKEPFIIALVTSRRTISSKPSSPSIGESAEETDNEPELLQIAQKAQVKHYTFPQEKELSQRDFTPTEYIKHQTVYDAKSFNAWRYGGYPLTQQKIANPRSQDPQDRKYAIISVEYYALDPENPSQDFIYQLSDIALVGSHNRFSLAWFNVHQNMDPIAKAKASADLGHMYLKGSVIAPNRDLAQKYLRYAFEQKDSHEAHALAAYYLGLIKYGQFLNETLSDEKEQLLKEALIYFTQAYEEQYNTISELVKSIAAKAAYYLGRIYDEVPAYKNKNTAENYFTEALRDKEFGPLAAEKLTEIQAIGTCCGISFFKKRNKVAPEPTSVYRKSAF